MSDSDSVEEILDRHFQIEGAIIRVFEPFQAKAALDRHYAQKHAAEVLELIGPDEPKIDWETALEKNLAGFDTKKAQIFLLGEQDGKRKLRASLRKAVEEYWGV